MTNCSGYVSAYEIAEVLKCSPSTIYKWARIGKIPVIRLRKKTSVEGWNHIKYLFDVDAVIEALEPCPLCEETNFERARGLNICVTCHAEILYGLQEEEC